MLYKKVMKEGLPRRKRRRRLSCIKKDKVEKKKVEKEPEEVRRTAPAGEKKILDGVFLPLTSPST
jgi:hypothetical protein